MQVKITLTTDELKQAIVNWIDDNTPLIVPDDRITVTIESGTATVEWSD